MSSDLGISIMKDGRIIFFSEGGLPDVVKRVEFYRDQRLFLFVYHNEQIEDQLVDTEIPEHITKPVETSPDVVIFSLFPDHPPIGYKAPLIKVGDIY